MTNSYEAVSERSSKLGANYPDPNSAVLLDGFDKVGAANLDLIDSEKDNLLCQQRYVRAALQKIITTMRHIDKRSNIKVGNEMEIAVKACGHPLLLSDNVHASEIEEVDDAMINNYMRFWPLKDVRKANERLFIAAQELLDASFKAASSEKRVILAEHDNDSGDIAIEDVRRELAQDIALAKQVMWVADSRAAEDGRLNSRSPKTP